MLSSTSSPRIYAPGNLVSIPRNQCARFIFPSTDAEKKILKNIIVHIIKVIRYDVLKIRNLFKVKSLYVEKHLLNGLW